MSGPLVPDSEGLWLLLRATGREIQREAVRVVWASDPTSDEPDGLSLFYKFGTGNLWQVKTEPSYLWAGKCFDANGEHVK